MAEDMDDGSLVVGGHAFCQMEDGPDVRQSAQSSESAATRGRSVSQAQRDMLALARYNRWLRRARQADLRDLARAALLVPFWAGCGGSAGAGGGGCAVACLPHGLESCRSLRIAPDGPAGARALSSCVSAHSLHVRESGANGLSQGNV